MTNYEFREKYMRELNFGKPESFWENSKVKPGMLFSIEKEELPTDLRREDFMAAMAAVKNNEGIIEDILTWGQYLTWCGLCRKYGAGWWKKGLLMPAQRQSNFNTMFGIHEEVYYDRRATATKDDIDLIFNAIETMELNQCSYLDMLFNNYEYIHSDAIQNAKRVRFGSQYKRK
jgi:hypothetical protein